MKGIYNKDFNRNWNVLTHFINYNSCGVRFHENPLNGFGVVTCARHGHTDMTKFIGDFLTFGAYAPTVSDTCSKNCYQNQFVSLDYLR